MVLGIGFGNSHITGVLGYVDVYYKSYWIYLQTQAQSKIKRPGLGHWKNGNLSRKCVCCSWTRPVGQTSYKYLALVLRAPSSISRTVPPLEPCWCRAWTPTWTTLFLLLPLFVLQQGQKKPSEAGAIGAYWWCFCSERETKASQNKEKRGNVVKKESVLHIVSILPVQLWVQGVLLPSMVILEAVHKV